jgi:VIT1/CCC1 family predicted Fe2+/Mn2+ transporter/rubrerythrin
MSQKSESVQSSEAVRRLLAAWRGEIEARYVYDVIAAREPDARRADVLRKIADAEGKHRGLIEARLREMGVEVPDPSSVHIPQWLRLQARLAPIDQLLRAREAAEDEEVLNQYGRPTGDAATDVVLHKIRQDERSHSMAVNDMLGESTAPEPTELKEAIKSRLDRMLSGERHRTGSGWVSDAIYGANDGLAAVFGMVAGVSGATGATRSSVLTAGLSGAIASALSMGVGAWLAARSSNEIAEATVAQERKELEVHPAEEAEELSLFYQLKGLSRSEADDFVAKLARSPEAMLSALTVEEFGGLEQGKDPWTSAVAGLASTGIGAIIPVIPFFFIGGAAGLITAFIVSLVAHFGVGAAKSLFTLRSWWFSGMEMTLAGLIVGGGTFALGLLVGVST